MANEGKNFKKVSSVTEFIGVGDIPVEDGFQGIFLESYEGKFGLNHKFEATASFNTSVTTNGETKDITITPGDLLVINGSGMLNSKLSRVTAKSEVLIEYQGMEPIKTGAFKGKGAHMVEISVAE